MAPGEALSEANGEASGGETNKQATIGLTNDLGQACL